MTQTPPISAEQVEALRSLEKAATRYYDAAKEHFSDTDYDRDGLLAEADAELWVIALPAARAALNAAASIPASRGVEREGRPVSFVWTDDMYTAFNAIQAMKSHPQPQELLAAWDALHGAAEYAASPALPVQEQEIDRLRTGLEKISAIRDSIIGFQNVGWSEHIYPLVAALHDAGFDGIGYDKARENVSTLLDLTKAAEAKVERLTEALKPFADEADSWHPEQSDATGVYTSKAALGDVPAFTIGDLRAARAALVKP